MSNDSNKTKLVSNKGIVCDLILTALFFFFMYGVIIDHVPFEKGFLQTFGTVYCTSSITGVFWLALQCLRVTWVDQMLNKK